MAFLIERRAAVAAQLMCPAKSFDPKACYECCDAKPLFCTLRQPVQTQEIIELRRKESRTPMTNPPALTQADIERIRSNVASFLQNGCSFQELSSLPRFGLILVMKNIMGDGDPQAVSKLQAVEDDKKSTYLWPLLCDYFKGKGITPKEGPAAAPAPAPTQAPLPAPEGLRNRAPALPPAPPAAPAAEAEAPPPAPPAPAATDTPAPAGKRGRTKATPAAEGAEASSPQVQVDGLKDELTRIRSFMDKEFQQLVTERIQATEWRQGLTTHITNTEKKLDAIERRLELLGKDVRRGQLLTLMLYEALIAPTDRENLEIMLDDIESRSLLPQQISSQAPGT